MVFSQLVVVVNEQLCNFATLLHFLHKQLYNLSNNSDWHSG